MSASRKNSSNANPARESADFEARARSAPEIYRFFNGAANCAGYLAGRWEGRGIQALPAWPVNIAMSLVLDYNPDAGLRASLRSRSPGRLARWLERFVKRRGPAAPSGRAWNGSFADTSAEDSCATSSGTSSGKNFKDDRGVTPSIDRYRNSFVFRLTDAGTGRPPENSFGPDYARLRQGDWEITLQVLENVRVHAQLRRLDGLAPIFFSGVLRKTR